MFREIINNIKTIEKDVLKVMFLGFKICLTIGFISSFILLYYILNPISYLIFECGIILFKISLKFAITFFICSIVINHLKKELD